MNITKQRADIAREIRALVSSLLKTEGPLAYLPTDPTHYTGLSVQAQEALTQHLRFFYVSCPYPTLTLGSFLQGRYWLIALCFAANIIEDPDEIRTTVDWALEVMNSVTYDSFGSFVSGPDPEDYKQAMAILNRNRSVLL